MIRDPDTGAVRYFGLYRGVIRDTKDPLGKRRARLLVPQVLFQTVTDWAFPLETAGVAAPTPLVGQGVWVQFEGGDPSFPVWTGTFGTSTTSLNLALEQLSDVTVVNPVDGALLSWHSATKTWIANASVSPTVITGTAVTRADTGTVTNSMLANSGVTVNGSPVSLGGTIIVQAVPVDGSVTSAKVSAGSLTNDRLVNSSVTINGSPVALGGAITVQAVPTNGSVDPTKIVAGGLPTSSITNLSSYVTGFRLDQFAAPSVDLSVNGVRVQNVGTPVNANDVATKGYADALVAGLNYKQEVKAATTANVALTGAPFTVDGVTLNAGDRILVKNQTTGSQNGIYVVAAGAWSRAADSQQLTAGTYVYIDQGTLAADSAWVLTTNDPITVGTTSLTFVQFSGAGQIVAGNGISKNGNQLSVLGTTGRVNVTSGAVDIDAGYVGQTSITTLGTITSGVWNGSTIAVNRGGTGQTAFAAGSYLIGNGTSGITVQATIPASDVTGLPAVSAPTGTMMMYAANTSTPPSGWLLCDGTAVSRTTYSALFSVIGSTHGAGNGTSTFNVPDMRGSFPVGRDSGQTEFVTIGGGGGAKTHTLTAAEMAHNHVMTNAYSSAFAAANGNQYTNGGTVSTNTILTGGVNQPTAAAHSILPPYTVLQFIIKT